MSGDWKKHTGVSENGINSFQSVGDCVQCVTVSAILYRFRFFFFACQFDGSSRHKIVECVSAASVGVKSFFLHIMHLCALWAGVCLSMF